MFSGSGICSQQLINFIYHTHSAANAIIQTQTAMMGMAQRMKNGDWIQFTEAVCGKLFGGKI